MLTVEVYKDKAGEFRTRIKRKGRVLFDSGEGYKRKGGALNGVHSVFTPDSQGTVYKLVDLTK